MNGARQALALLRWYLRELFDETGYDHYVRHQRRNCPTGPVLTRREYEQLKTNQNVRCC
jgi:uncharacterized short protein YbdD (DUF466 family)